MSANNAVAVRDSGQPVELRTIEQQNAENAAVARLVMSGNLKGLTPEQKMQVYISRCDALGLDVRAAPFEVIDFKGKEVLYPKKEAAEQLRKINSISTKVIEEVVTPEGILRVKIRGWDKTGREDEEVAAVFVKGLQGPDLANAIMKATTKAKRRVTLSMCGLGAMAEIDEDDPQVIRRQELNMETGELVSIVEQTGEILEDPDAGRKDALARLHAAGKGAGLGHDQLRAFAQVHFPAIDSLTELGEQELNILADTVREAKKAGLLSQADVIEAETVHEMGAEIEQEFLTAIEKAGSIDELVKVGERIRDGGLSSGRLREAFGQRQQALRSGSQPQPAAPDYLAKIAAAETMEQLEDVATAIQEAGASTAALRTAFANKAAKLGRLEELGVTQPELVPDDEMDPERFTN